MVIALISDDSLFAKVLHLRRKIKKCYSVFKMIYAELFHLCKVMLFRAQTHAHWTGIREWRGWDCIAEVAELEKQPANNKKSQHKCKSLFIANVEKKPGKQTNNIDLAGFGGAGQA